jgi:hypothetical protein
MRSLASGLGSFGGIMGFLSERLGWSVGQNNRLGKEFDGSFCNAVCVVVGIAGNAKGPNDRNVS